MALIGSITNWGEIQGQINDANGVLTGVISSAELLGGQVVGMRGLKGDKGDTGDTGATGADGQDGADGFSPSASVSKVGDTTTITITDKDGTTTASVYDGKDDVFVAEYGVTTYDEIDDAFFDGKAIILKWQSAGYYRYFPCSVIDTSSSYQLTFLMGKSIAYDVEVSPLTPPLDWSYSSRNLQETLVSGTNIKTINNTSLLGSGNIDIQSGGGASAFIAEYGVTTYADVKDAYDEDAIILCTVDDSGNTVICHLAYYDDANGLFYFAQPKSDGFYLAIIASDDTWDDSYFTFASTDTATQLRDGLMSALDWQKLDGIASGAEVNVQSDWNEADNTKDDFIKNKPTIPTKVSELNNDSGFITTETDPTVPSWAKQASKPSYTFSEIGSKPSTISGYGITDAKISSGTITLGSDSITPLTSFTETDPVFTASDAYGITSSDITDWDNSYDGKVSLDTSAASGTDHDLYAAIVALGWQNDVIEA